MSECVCIFTCFIGERRSHDSGGAFFVFAKSVIALAPVHLRVHVQACTPSNRMPFINDVDDVLYSEQQHPADLEDGVLPERRETFLYFIMF